MLPDADREPGPALHPPSPAASPAAAPDLAASAPPPALFPPGSPFAPAAVAATGTASAADGAQRFLASCARTLTRQGLTVATRTRFGSPREQILLERSEGRHDLLVLGAPLPRGGGHIDLGGLMARLLRECEVPVLIVRSPEAAG